MNDMTAQEALAFAQELQQAADALERKNRYTLRKPKGAPRYGTWVPSRWKDIYEDYSIFKEALAAVRAAARWYERVGTLGFSAVHRG